MTDETEQATMPNPFTQSEILALACLYTPEQHALARLKDQQCMEGLRERITELEEQVETDMACRVCGCTYFNPCNPPCAWAEPHLCTTCAELEKDL
ncbi:MAG: hypothetical protein COB49_07500 [Alphaproteobacteria bacterium]|nr:MAG: hypothetical protein COB49_07500 [Alphaproteobacteria bacterium]